MFVSSGTDHYLPTFNSMTERVKSKKVESPKTEAQELQIPDQELSLLETLQQHLSEQALQFFLEKASDAVLRDSIALLKPIVKEIGKSRQFQENPQWLIAIHIAQQKLKRDSSRQFDPEDKETVNAISLKYGIKSY